MCLPHPTPPPPRRQDLVAAPTILGTGGVLLGSKASKVFALNPQTGEPLHVTDADHPDGADDGFPLPSPSREEVGRLLISRSSRSSSAASEIW